MADGIIASIISQVDAATASYVTSIVTTVISEAKPVVKQCFLLYVVLWGFAMYRGAIHEPILDGAFRLMRVGLIMSLAVGVGQYQSLIADNLVALPDYFTRLFGGSGGTVSSAENALDEILGNVAFITAEIWNKGSLSLSEGISIGPYFLAIIMWMHALASVGYAAFLMILSKIALSVIVATGPMFIACLMFDGTKKFFEAWVGQVFNYAFVSAFAVATVKFLFGIEQSIAEGIKAASTATIGLPEIASFCLISMITFLVLMQVQNMASGVSGGAAIQTLGAVQWAMSAARSAGKVAGQSTKAAGRAANAARPSNIANTVSRTKERYGQFKEGAAKDIAATKQAAALVARPTAAVARAGISAGRVAGRAIARPVSEAYRRLRTPKSNSIKAA